MVHRAEFVSTKTGKIIQPKDRTFSNQIGADFPVANFQLDPNFDPIQSLLIQASGVEFEGGAARATSVASAQGRRVENESGVQRFVIPLPKKKSRTLGVAVGGGQQAREFAGVPAFSSIGGLTI